LFCEGTSVIKIRDGHLGQLLIERDQKRPIFPSKELIVLTGSDEG
jgi:hypothetical protein